jgi:hypothetical protein
MKYLLHVGTKNSVRVSVVHQNSICLYFQSVLRQKSITLNFQELTIRDVIDLLRWINSAQRIAAQGLAAFGANR